MKKINIAGKVSGLPIHKVTFKFGKAQRQLEKLSYDAVNPLEVVNDWNATWQEAMSKCVNALVECDALFLLPDYEDSKGAQYELECAKELNLDIYYDINKVPENK